MKVTKSDMQKEAAMRMELLGLNEEIISGFQKTIPEIYISANSRDGNLIAVYTIKDDIISEDIEAIEKQYGWLVYHVICVGKWEMIKDWLKRTNSKLSKPSEFSEGSFIFQIFLLFIAEES